MFPRAAGLCGRVFVQWQQQQQPIFCKFCLVSKVSDVTLESFWVGFSDSFVLQGHGVSRPAGLCGRVFVQWQQQQQQPISCKFSVSRVSDVTLESFWVGFSDSFVLQGHGVSPSGRAVWPCFCAVAAAAAASFWVGFSDSFVLQGHGVSPSGRIVWPCFCAVAAAAATAAAAANFLQVFCSLSRVSDVTLESFWVGFSDSFVLQGHGVSPSCRAVRLCLYAVAAAAANFLQVFCSVSRVSDVTLDSFWVGFSDSFVLQGHSVSPSGRAVWLCLYAVAAAAAANFLQVFCSVSRVSDVTWESFWVGFSDSFVLQGHHVSPSGRAVWTCFCAVAAAAAANFLQVFCSVSRVSDVTLDSF